VSEFKSTLNVNVSDLLRLLNADQDHPGQRSSFEILDHPGFFTATRSREGLENKEWEVVMFDKEVERGTPISQPKISILSEIASKKFKTS